MGTAFVLFVYLFVKVLFSYVAPFAIGLALALLFEPLVSRLNKRFRLPRAVLALLCILCMLGIIGTAGTIVTARVINEARAFVESMPRQIDAALLGFNNLKSQYVVITELIPEELRATADNLGSSALLSATASASAFVRTLSTAAVRVVPGTLFGGILCLISMFFFIKDRPLIASVVSRNSPQALTRNYNAVKQGLLRALAGYVRAQATLMLITASICGVSLTIMQSPFVLFMSLLVAFFDFLPVFGPGFILWPWALGAAVSGKYGMAIGLLITYLIITITRQVLEPKVLGSNIGIHPLLTLMSIFVGLNVFGAPGIFVGPFIVISLKAMNEASVV